MRVNPRASSAVGGNFGLSPRVSSAAVRSAQQPPSLVESNATSALSSHAHPRIMPSPKVAHTSEYTSNIPAYDGTLTSSGWESAMVGAGGGGNTGKRRTATVAPSNHHNNKNPYTQWNVNSFVKHSSKDIYSKDHLSPPSSPCGGVNNHHHNDDEDDDAMSDLRIWKQQQKLLEIQTRNLNFMKYGFIATMAMMVIIILYLVSQNTNSASYRSSSPSPTVSGGTEFHVPADSDSIRSVSSPSDPLPDHDLLLVSGTELEESRRAIAEWTRQQIEFEREALYEIDPSAKNVIVDPNDETIAKLTPVARALHVIPQPGAPSLPTDAHAYASRHQHSPHVHEAGFDETPDTLRRIAESKATWSSDDDLDDSDDGVSYPIERLIPQRGLHGEVDSLPLASVRVPAKPAATTAAHLVIETLLHERLVEGDTPKEHSHKDHPTIPKFGGKTHAHKIEMPPPDAAYLRRIERAKQLKAQAEAREAEIEALEAKRRQKEEAAAAAAETEIEQSLARDAAAAAASAAGGASVVGSAPVAVLVDVSPPSTPVDPIVDDAIRTAGVTSYETIVNQGNTLTNNNVDRIESIDQTTTTTSIATNVDTPTVGVGASTRSTESESDSNRYGRTRRVDGETNSDIGRDQPLIQSNPTFTESSTPSPPASRVSIDSDVDSPPISSVVSSLDSSLIPPMTTPTTSNPSDDDDDLLSQLSSASRPHDVARAIEDEAEKLNKHTGLKGPVLRDANVATAATTTTTTTPLDVDDDSMSLDSEPSSPVDGGGGSFQIPPRIPMTAEERRAAGVGWTPYIGKSLSQRILWPVDTSIESLTKVRKDDHPYLFDDDVQFIVLTSLKNQALARKVRMLYGPLIKRLTFISDGRDNGLNATVLQNPHPEWTMKNMKEIPWRTYELFKMLNDPERAPYRTPAKFYFVMHDTTFPILDQIKWRLETYVKLYHGNYPNFVGGRKSSQTFESTYWKEQQTIGLEIFGGKKLFVVPCQNNNTTHTSARACGHLPTRDGYLRFSSLPLSLFDSCISLSLSLPPSAYIYGFDHHFLNAVSDYTNAASCPVLPTEGLALAGLVECAGGILEQTEYDFLLQTRSNHREKLLTQDSTITKWRGFDGFNGCNTPGMLQEAYDWYYGKLHH